MAIINDEDFVEMKVMLARIDQRLDTLKDVKADVGNVRKELGDISNKLIDNSTRISTLENDVRELEAHNTWLRRTLVGSIITAVVGLGFALIQLGL